MMDSFVTTHRFFDNKHYPRGFSRYGHFTIRESYLLEEYGCAYKGLSNGSRIPITDEERRFVLVCCGKTTASTVHEKVWIKYTEYIQKPKKIHTLLGGDHQTDILEDHMDLDDQLILRD